jgi:hypothetical protein
MPRRQLGNVDLRSGTNPFTQVDYFASLHSGSYFFSGLLYLFQEDPLWVCSGSLIHQLKP